MAAAEGAEGLDEDSDASTPESAAGGSNGSTGRPLRGPFDRFVRGLEVRSPQGPPPTFGSLFAAMQSAPRPDGNTVAEATSDVEPATANGDSHDREPRDHDTTSSHPRHAPATAHDDSHHRSGHGSHHASERRATDHHASESHHGHGSRHARRDEPATPARAPSPARGDAGVAITTPPDASVVTVARSRGAQDTQHTEEGDGTGGDNAAARLPRGGAQASSRHARAPRSEVIDIRRERPRLGAWFIVGLALGASLASSVRRKEPS